jgi:hypothetical protein
MPKKRDRGKQKAFLEAFKRTANLSKAAEGADVDRSTHFRWLRGDSDYATEFELAREEAITLLEDEAVRRAHEGTLRAVFYKGKASGAVREYSDTLLVVLLKAHKPEKYRENWKGEISGPGGGPIPLHDGRLNNLTDGELAELIALAGKLATPGSPEG